MTGYEYQRSSTVSHTWIPVSGGENASEIIVSGLTGGTTYYFQVRAVNTEGGGPFAEVSTIPNDGPIPQPGAPTNLGAAPGDRQVVLSWNSASPIGGSVITGYEYQQSLTDTFDNTWAPVSGGGDARKVIVFGLTGGTAYFFRLRAVNSQGAGTASTEVSVIPNNGPTTEPGVPGNLTSISGDHQVTLSWEAPSHTGASDITGYEYQKSPTSGEFGDTWTEVSGERGASEVIVPHLTGGTTYSFRVRAVNSQGAGDFTEVSAIAYDGPTAEPGVPTNLSIISGDRQVTLNWGLRAAGLRRSLATNISST